MLQCQVLVLLNCFYRSQKKKTRSPTSTEVVTEGPSDVAAQVTDQFSDGLHDCSLTGTCIPREGSYDRACNLGFEGDGKICNGMP